MSTEITHDQGPAGNESGVLATLRSEVSTGARAPGRARTRILTETEALLSVSSLHELSVARILDAAGITRPTFYSYFRSKSEVLAALYLRAAGEVREAVWPLFDRPAGWSPAEAITEAMNRMAEVWSQHRTVLATGVENRHAIPEIRQATADMLAVFVDGIASQLDRDRAGGLAPPGPSATAAVSTLVWSTDQTFYTAGRGLNPDLPDEAAAARVLAVMWLRTLYAWTPPAPRPPASER